MTTGLITVTLAGRPMAFGKTDTTPKLRDLGISDIIGETPSTARCKVRNQVPTVGMEIIAALTGSSERIFAGRVIAVHQVSIAKAQDLEYSLQCIDYTWELNKQKVNARYIETTVSDILDELLAGTGYTGTFLEAAAGAVVIDEITFTNEDRTDCLSRLAKRIGAYWYRDYTKDIHFFFSETGSDPTALSATHSSLELKSVATSIDLSQMITRVYGEGGGGTAVSDVAVGTTILPVDVADWYNTEGGTVQVGPQRLTYTGVQAGGAGAIAGPGLSPSDALSAIDKAGTGIDDGVHDYAYTWVTAAGETIPSPLKRVTHGDLATPASAPTFVGNSIDGTTAYDVGDSMTYKFTYSGAAGYGDYTADTAASPVSAAMVAAAGPPSGDPYAIIITGAYSTDTRCRFVNVWRSVNGGAYTLVENRANLPTGGAWSFTDVTAAGGAAFPSAAPELNRTTLSVVPLGPQGVTSRKVYRTVASGSQLKLQQTIADNTTLAGVDDSTADASLGADAPTGDTSGLQQEILNGAGFYPTVTGFATNGAATSATSSAPVFSSATYTFVAADVGAVLYIKAGTNWTVGRYRIVSVAAGAATLDRACASVASPTNGTWGVDYSVLSSPRISFTDLAIGATNTQFASTLNPVGPNFVGNVLAIRDGIGFIVQRIIITGTTGGTIGVADKIIGIASATGGFGNLGGAAPATTIAAGATTLLLASSAGFSSTGGWAIIGNGKQVIRYTGVSGNTLTGIPASGIGAITAAIGYGSTVTASPALTGIPSSSTGSVLYAITQGEPVNVLAQADAVDAQALLATYIGGDGIQDDVITDNRMTETEIAARAQAHLELHSPPRVTLRYRCRDIQTKAGRTIAVPGYAGTVVDDGAVGYWRLVERGYARQVMASGPVGFWRLGEASGTTANDEVSTNDGTYTNTPTLGVEGPISDRTTAATFAAASSEYVTMGDVAAFEFTSAFSAEAWVKYTSTGAVKMIVGKAVSGTNRGWLLSTTSGGFLKFAAISAADVTIFDITTAAVYNDGIWHHVVATWDGTTGANKVQIYVDGVVVKQGTAVAGTPDANAAPFAIGAYGSLVALFFDGSLADVAVYGRELSAAEIAAHSAARYDIDATVSALAADEIGSNHGTLTKGPTLGASGPLSTGDPAITLNGTTQYVTMGDVAAFEFTSAFSAEAWVKYTSTGAVKMIVGKSASSTNRGWALRAESAGALRFTAFSVADVTIFDITTAAVYNDGVWHHVVATWDGTTGANKVQIYVDGVVVKQGTAVAGTPDANAAPFAIGSFGNLNALFFNGSLAEVAVYDVELSAAQITQHYAQRKWVTGDLGDLVIQRVEISAFSDVNPALFPTYDVEASSSRFSFEDLLRRIPR